MSGDAGWGGPGRDAPGSPPPPGWGPPPGYGPAPGPGHAYGPPGYPPPGYPPYGYYGQSPRTDGNAIAALCFAVGSFVVCPFVPAVVALVLAGQSRREIEGSGGWVVGEGLNTAAVIISWVNIAMCAFLLMIFFGALA